MEKTTGRAHKEALLWFRGSAFLPDISIPVCTSWFLSLSPGLGISSWFIKRYILLPHFISCRSGTPISCLLNHRYFPTSHKGSVNFSFKIFFFLHSSDWMIYTDLSSGLLKISFANPHKSWNLCSEYLTSDVVLFCSKMYICLFNKVLIQGSMSDGDDLETF